MKRQSTGMMKQQQDHTPSDKEEDTAKAKSSEKSAGGGGGPTGGGVNGKVPTKLSELTPEEKVRLQREDAPRWVVSWSQHER